MKSTLLLLGVFVGSIATACGSAYAPAQEGESTPAGSTQAVFDLENPTYLEIVVEPCAPLEWSDADPCALRDWDTPYWIEYYGPYKRWGVEVEREIQLNLPYPPHTLIEELRSEFEHRRDATGYGYSGYLPHIVARGVFVPGTARCVLHEHKVYAHDGPQLLIGSTGSPDIECYMDLKVREYVIGRGPEVLTVRPFSDVYYVWEQHEFYKTTDYLKKVSKLVDAEWVDSEWVVELSLNGNKGVEVWSVREIADLQRRADGTVFIYRNNLVELYTEEYGDVSEYVDVLEPPWDEYVRNMRSARATLEAEHEFRFADDANLKHLREHLKEYGHYELFAEYISPPPPQFTD